MREQLQAYYADKKIFRRIVIGIVFVLLIMFLFSNQHPGSSMNRDHKIAFAGEQMPTVGRYQLNIERLDREIALLQANPAQFLIIHKRRNLLMPMIERQLKKAGLPDDLKYIAVVESSLRDNVVSSAGAAGLRQLMSGTAVKQGLLVNDFVDERYDAAKATAAAINHLKGLYSIYKQRTLTIAAYNRGANGLSSSMQNQYSDDFYDLRLNTETSRYVFRVLAMKYVREHRYSIFGDDMLGEMYTPFTTKEMSVKSIPDIAQRAKENGFGYYEIKKLNPRLLKNSLPEGKRNIEVFSEEKYI